MGTNAQETGVLTGQYQEWCRTQYTMAHHDVWWPKEQQMAGANSTLLLLGAIVGASKLIWAVHLEMTILDLITVSLLSALAVTFGIAYAWSLHRTMVRARGRAKKIAGLVEDKYGALKEALAEPE